jgi:2,3-bisphosphoglycerate-independent phosphoglycerate mutase
MRRTIVIVPALVGVPGGDSVLRQSLPSLQALSELGTVFKIDPMPPLQTPEALYLGMRPNEAQMAQGPLTVSALGADPPERSTHFHLSLLSLDDETVTKPAYVPTADEERDIWTVAKRLDTRSLTLLQGERLDHALVWEGLGDFETHSGENGPLTLREHLPQGDAEGPLRRLIDDSVNLLNELELNHKRIDEGLPPFNIFWPWGHGRRVSVPNLALRRGEPAVVESGSMRLQGLTRLAGYSHVDRASVGKGMKTRFTDIAKRCLKRDLTIVVVEGAAELRELNRLEELEWLAREMEKELLAPLLEDVIKEKSRLTLLAPGQTQGLGITSAARSERPLPFDERTLEEKGVPIKSLPESVEASM